ncbi:hypothetical protein OENI_1450001 [Oenococcus oeni]|nr:hypothetical protein OENI_1450001 [Oenococcus oeni]
MRNCCEINTLSVLKTFYLMYDNLPKILSHTLSRQSCLQLLMYYLIYNGSLSIAVDEKSL